MFGLHCGFRRRTHVQRAVFVLLLIIHVLGVLSVGECWHRRLLQLESKSSSTVAILVSEFGFIGSVICFQARIICHHGIIQLLHERNGRGSREFLVQVILAVPPFLIGIRNALFHKFWYSLLKELYFVVLQLNTIVLFMVSDDILFNLQSLLDNILAYSSDIERNQGRIRDARWDFRDRVQDANRIFAWIWAARYLQMPATVVFVVAEVTYPEVGNFDRLIMLTFEAFLLARLFQLVWAGSNLQKSCLRIEERFLNSIQVYVSAREPAKAIFPVIIFREEWDVLWNGCFPLSTKCFFSFLATSVTFTAAILQFDHRVNRVIIDATIDPRTR